MNDRDITGGALNNGSVALNWHPTSHIKISFNTILADRQDWNPVWIFQGRLQVVY